MTMKKIFFSGELNAFAAHIYAVIDRRGWVSYAFKIKKNV